MSKRFKYTAEEKHKISREYDNGVETIEDSSYT